MESIKQTLIVGFAEHARFWHFGLSLMSEMMIRLKEEEVYGMIK